MKVHLWYPADQGGSDGPPPNRVPRCAASRSHSLGHPLAWHVEAEIARETDAIEPARNPLPVIVFSHGSTNDPIDYAHTSS